MSPYETIKKSVNSMNSLPSEKYKQIPNNIERKTFKSEVDRERFNFSRLEKISRQKVQLEKSEKKIYQRKKLKLRSLLEVGEEVHIPAAQLKKKDSLGKFHKSSADNKYYFHKEKDIFDDEQTKN